MAAQRRMYQYLTCGATGPSAAISGCDPHGGTTRAPCWWFGPEFWVQTVEGIVGGCTTSACRFAVMIGGVSVRDCVICWQARPGPLKDEDDPWQLAR